MKKQQRKHVTSAENSAIKPFPEAPLTSLEWNTCWMAVQYAKTRRTAVCAMLPDELVKAYGRRWTQEQKAILLADLNQVLETSPYFGDPEVDHKYWERFRRFLDPAAYYVVSMPDSQTHIVFEAMGYYFPLETYLTQSGRWIFIPGHHITPEQIKPYENPKTS